MRTLVAATRPLRTFLGGAGLAAALAVAPPAVAQDLAPPPPIDPTSPGAPTGPGSAPGGKPVNEDGKSTAEQLDESEKKDTGRNFELFYVNGDVGLSYINLSSFNASNLALEKTDSLGPSFSLGAGVRLLLFQLGVRARLNQLSMFSLWQLNAEAAFHFAGQSRFDPYLGFHAGYSFVGTLDSSAVSAAGGADPSRDVSVHGFNGGLDLGGDYYFSSLFSLGLALQLEGLFLHRPPVALPAGVSDAVKAQLQAQPLYQSSGDAAGFGGMVGVRLGLHLGL
jgi:hypothetical protein